MDASVTIWEATAPVKLPTWHCPPFVTELGPRTKKSGISLSAPPKLTLQLQSLPPILHISGPSPVPSCSKAPRGLFVPLRVASICTRLAISPSPSLRQCSDRYAIHAGRNLPDKGFRYLRTVRVTAAVHRGFGSTLPLDKSRFTSLVNLPALGRRQPLYFGFPLSRDLCFC